MQSPRIPWEVIERVIGHSGNNPRSLRSFSLTCRELLPCSRCVMLAGGVKLRSRDHAFALVDFLHANPHLKPFIGSMTVHLTDFPPFPLLPILSNLSEITFTHNRKPSVDTLPVPSLHPRDLAGFRLFGSRLQTLRLLQVSFTTSLAFVQLLLAFSSITHLVCQGVTIGIEGNQGPLAVAKQRLSEKLRLQSLASDSESLAEFAVPRRHYTPGDVLLDPNFKLASSAVERLEIINKIKPNLSSRLRLSEWSRLQSLTLYRPYGPSEALAPVFGLLNSVDSATCKDVTIQFDQEPHIVDLIQGLNPRYDRELAQIPLTFSRVTIVWSIRPLRATRNSFWTRELKTHFPMLSQHPNATFVLKSETVFPAGHDDHVLAFVISPDSKWIASGSYDSTIIVWDTRDGSIAQQWASPSYKPVFSLAFSPDSRYLVSGGADGKTVVWDVLDSARMVASLEGHTEAVTGCAWSPDGTIIATASSDIPMQMWDARTFHVLHIPREALSKVKLHQYSSPRVMFSPDGRWLASTCSTDSYCSIWDVPKGTSHKVIQDDQDSCLAYSITPRFDPKSTRLVTALTNNMVEIWDIETGKRLSVSHQCAFNIYTASFSPDGQLFLVASQGGLEIWEFQLGFELPELKGLGRISTGRGVRDAQFSPCGKYITSAGDDCTVLLWGVSDGTCMAKLLEHEESVAHVAFSPDGKTLSSAADDGSIVIRHMRDVIPVELVEHHSTLLDISVASSSFLLSDPLV